MSKNYDRAIHRWLPYSIVSIFFTVQFVKLVTLTLNLVKLMNTIFFNKYYFHSRLCKH